MLVNESVLLNRLASGDIEAFSVLYRHYAPVIRLFTRKIVKSTELSYDLTQDVFIKVWNHRLQLREVSAFQSYLYTVAKNVSFNFLKRAATDSRAKSLILKDYPQEQDITVDSVVTTDYMEYLNRLLDMLTPQSREVFRLCRQEQKTYDEAATLLGISRNTVKKHMVRTMKVLGEAVERDLGISLGILLAVVLSR